MAVRGDRLFLLGRNLESMHASATDLMIRAPRSVRAGVAFCDLERPDTFEPALDAAEAALGRLDLVVVTAALFARQERLESDRALTHQLLSIDFTNTILFCEHARRRLMARGGGTLCVCSSVAGERGRASVVLYGAAKAGLTHYLEGLDHRFRSEGLVTVCVKPGFVTTSMTSGLPTPPFAGSPDRVARQVLDAIDRGSPVVYVPRIWSGIMFVVRFLPRFVMRRVTF
jgi:decaprenylphospho-beta-D-erythro-pentofuranosid-2-ulose 2-reductase